MQRIFVAIRPPAAVRATLLAAMGGIEGARWQDEEQLHLTLRFCGESEAWRTDELHARLAALAFAPFPLALRGVGHFEKQGRVHTLWAGLAPSEPLTALQAKVERACQAAGYAPEGRRFAPHITLARGNQRPAAVAGWIADHALLAGAPWQVDGFALYESQLSLGGARYVALDHYLAR
ncbi:MAG: RNA 2',3'-cyclic phosphodiesterase [Sphingomonadales bacterium]|nr:RNA 2',3'-cyclic phosphodiesterase [Sphingomonadales bacterium]MBD3775201.1 RNA 2',3'-cyclic phosphodiesterase [Paracoccaceae bacterium]